MKNIVVFREVSENGRRSTAVTVRSNFAKDIVEAGEYTKSTCDRGGDRGTGQGSLVYGQVGRQQRELSRVGTLSDRPVMAERGDGSVLSQEQIDFFHRHGYLILRQLIGGSELEILQRAADTVQLMGAARVGPDHRYTRSENGVEVYWRSEHLWQRNDIFQVVTVHPDLLEAVGQCIGQSFYPMNDSLVVKLPYAGTRVTWHQDPPYGDARRAMTLPVPNFTTDIYLDHSGPENGCVYAIPDHHLVGHVDLKDKDQEALFNDYGAIPLEMEPGDVLFHCLSTPHGSRPNRSYRQRRIFYLHYVTSEVYHDAYAAWGKWDDGIHEKIQTMMALRREYGYESPLTRDYLRFDDNGLCFRGSPSTAKDHWADLQQALTTEAIERLKRLPKIRDEMSQSAGG